MVNGKIIHIAILLIMFKNLYYKTKYFFLINLILILSSCSEPDYRLVGGESGKLNDFLGKWLVINYWADWCPPCIKEMPELENFYKDNKEQALVLTYNFDRLEGEELDNQIIRFGVNVPSILSDPGVLFGWEAPPSLPATYIISPEGKLIHTLIGPQTQESLELLINP
jgi:thiol-disulfide isomerase/thioredoxin